MDKKHIITIFLCITLFVIITGCTTDENQKNNNIDTGNTYSMTAKEVYNDTLIDTDWTTFFNISYETLEDGDTLIIQDTIDKITYNTELNRTIITFDVSNAQDLSNTLNYPFKGDITTNYAVGDEVEITTKIVKVQFTDDTSGTTINYNLELFEKQWTNKEDYIATQGGDLPASSINKI